MDIVLVAAIAENGVIGRGNALPWRLKSDMLHFRAITMGKPVIMGRKTWLTLKRPLPGRTTIVVSRDKTFAAPGVLATQNLVDALTAARGDALRRNADAIMVAGGAEIYAHVLALASRLAVTHVHKRFDGEARFPVIDPDVWRETERTERQPADQDEAAFAFVTYERRSGSRGIDEAKRPKSAA